MNNQAGKKHPGSCHCGVVQFEIISDFEELTTCDCSICQLKNALMIKYGSNPDEWNTHEQANAKIQCDSISAKVVPGSPMRMSVQLPVLGSTT